MLKIIINFLGVLISITGNLIYAKIVLNKNICVNKYKLISTIIIVTMLCVTFNLYLSGLIKTLLILVMHIIEIRYLFRIDHSKAILSMLVYSLLLMLSDLIVLFVTVGIINIDKVYYYEYIAGSIIGNVAVASAMLLLAIMLKKYLKKITNIKIESDKTILIFSFLSLVCIGLLFYNIIAHYEHDHQIFSYVVAVVVFITVLFSSYKQKIDNDRVTNQYDKLLIFIRTYEEEIEKQRIFCHETKNQFLAIKSKILDKDKKSSIISYIDDILKDNTIISREQYAKFQYLPANGIKGLFYFKCKEAEDRNINVSINIASSVKDSFIYDLNAKEFNDLGKILGVYLDNAIEASEISKDKKMGVEIYLQDGNVEVYISNTYKGIIDDRIGEIAYSTKGKNRGHGLLLVEHIIKRNNMFESSKNITEYLYIQRLTIKKK